MRWPLKNQIMVRMILVLLLAIAAITYANIRTTIGTSRTAEMAKLDQILTLMRKSSFPLTPSVLENMKSLSGADFVVSSEEGQIISKTVMDEQKTAERLLPAASKESSDAHKIELGGRAYYLASLSDKDVRFGNSHAGRLHVLLPRKSNWEIWWAASRSPLLIACFAFPIALLVSLAMASQVTQPLSRLRAQVQKIADGDIQLIPEVSGNNEVRDLGLSINEMASRLKDHEVQLRRNERLNTMVQVGRSVGHHLRNSATGCRMAIELLASEKAEVASSQNYDVAIRQMDLMDGYIKRFLLMSRTPEERIDQTKEPIELGGLLDDLVFLLRPTVQHLGVELNVFADCDDSKILIGRDDAQQLLMNLIRNAISAANEAAIEGELDGKGIVDVKLTTIDGDFIFEVRDNGAGPSEEIADDIFKPFVTGSPEGTGLGLSLVDQIVQSLGGNVDWFRKAGMTYFIVRLQQTDKISHKNMSCTNT